MNKINAVSALSSLSRLEGHKLNFLTPVNDPLRGIPLGDGSTGLLYWPDKDKIVFNINNTDLWKETTEKEIHNWNPESEEHTNALLSAGVLEITYNNPAFDTIYQEDYRGSLSLKDATLDMHSRTCFSDVLLSAFCSEKYRSSVIKINSDFAEEVACEITLKNWGSRTFGHWYAQINRDASVRIDDTDCSVTGDTVYIKRNLNGKVFCTALYAENGIKTAVNKHSAKVITEKSAKQQNTLILTVAAADDFAAAVNSANERIELVKADIDKVYSEHISDWHKFWDKSYIQLDDDYLENLWYLNNYYANCQMKGAYPPHFCNGIWGFNHDYVPWNHMFHWNMQLEYWGLLAAGHGDLTKCYLNFRSRQLPAALKAGKKYRNVNGALYTDVSGANAVCDANTVDNLTPGAQIAHAFWQYYLYSGDLEYLCEKGYPVIYNAAMLYYNLLKKGDDGFYHIYRSQAYESSPIMDDVITDCGAMKTVFHDLINCIDTLVQNGRIDKPDCYERLKEILPKTSPVKTVPMEDDEYEIVNGKKVISSGIGKGTEIKTNEVPVVGIFCGEERNPDEAELEDSEYWSKIKKGDLIRNTFSSKKLSHYYGFPNPEYSYVFPNACIGLAQKDSKLFSAMQNLVYMKEPFEFSADNQISLNRIEKVPGMGWSLEPIVLARLGMAEYLKQLLNDSVVAWQFYPCGLGHYGPYENMQNESNLRFYTHNVKDAKTGERFDFPAWDFRHFDYEMLPITAMAINEMLLQSFEGVIRVFPAVTDDYTGSFKLYAENRITVYSAATNGEVDYIYLCGNADNIKVVNPWKFAPYITDENGGEISVTETTENNERIISFKLCGSALLLKNNGDIKLPNIDLAENKESKHKKRSMLGIPKMY